MANNISNVWKLMGIDPTTGTGTYKNRMGLGNAITRDNGIPLDLSALHATYNDAVVYAATSSIAYVDQPIAAEGVLYLITEESQGKVKISSYRDSITGKLVSGEEKEYDVYLKRVGIVPTGDNASVVVSGEGLVKLFAFDGAQAGAVPVKEDGKLVWKTLEEIGAGDGNDNTTYEFEVCEHKTGIVITPLFNGQPIMEGEGEEAKQVKYHLDLDVYTKAEVDAAIKVVADKVGVPAEGDTDTKTLYERIAAEILRATQAEGALSDRIGVAKDGETAATGVYAYVDGVVNALVNGVDPDKIDSLNELIAWVEAHPDIVSDLDERLDTVEAILDGFGGEEEPANVKVYIDAELDAHELAADEKYATKQEVTNAGYAVATDVARDYATKQELTNHATAADAKYATKDELAPVTQTANNAATKADNLETRINDIVATGGEPNAINTIKVNGTALTIDAQKAVDITVPTSITGMDGYSALDARVTENTNDIAALEGQLGTTNTNVSGLTTRLAALEAEVGEVAESRIDALEGAVAQHTTDIAENTAAITTLNTQTIPAIQQAIADGDKAINDKIGTVEEGKTVDDMINAVAGKIDFSPYAKKDEVAATYATIAALEGVYKAGSGVEGGEGYVAPTGILAEEIARAKAAEKKLSDDLAILISNPTEDLDSVVEIIEHVKNNGTAVTGIISRLDGHDTLLAGIGGDGQPANVMAAIEAAAYVLPGATVEALGGIKSAADVEGKVSVNKVYVDATTNVAEVKAFSTDNLVQGAMTLVLNGGDAQVTA